MSRNMYAAARLVDGDPVRRAAYERAMQILAGRSGVSDALTNAQRDFIRNFEAPELLGDRSRLPSARRENVDA